MELINKIFDNRIQAFNLLFEISLDEYQTISQKIIDKNEFQRRRVKSSSTVYNLLKKDLAVGCIIPPIVLALSNNKIDYKITAETEPELVIKKIKDSYENLIILDGLQRTYTIRDLFKEVESNGDIDLLEKLKIKKIRIEIYVGINKLGILYRMLTLNTGQTPMSMRHQIEILYSDYLEEDINGIKLLAESDDRMPKKDGEYKFKEIIEGFNSYLDRDYLPINRNDVLENIESLEKLSEENQGNDLFQEYLKTFHKLSKTLINKSDNWEYDEDNMDKKLSSQPFGKNARKIFTKPQVMTGFGSAIGKLVDFKSIADINSCEPLIEKIVIENPTLTFNNLVSKLDSIRTIAKKIGNDQRMFFHFLFRELFDIKGDAYLNLNKAVEEAYTTYIRKTQ